VAEEPTSAPVVTDRRVPPRGVLPRGAQTWLMVAIAGAILVIIALTGQRAPSTTPTTGATERGAVPNPERLRDYQARLRLLQQRNESVEPVQPDAPLALPRDTAAQAHPTADPIADEQRRRDFTSLFAENVAWARKGGQLTVPREGSVDVPSPALPTVPQTTLPRGDAPGNTFVTIHEGTILEAVLTNRLDGGTPSPVNCLVTTSLYARNGQLVIPAGARVLGQTKAVQAFGESRLAVAFHRLLMPNGRTHALEQLPGANQSGDLGLRDRASQHYVSAFGAAAAIGLISGLSQALGSIGSAGSGPMTITANAGDGTAQAASQILNRFLNRPPTLTIREGHRIVIYLTSDLQLPPYADPAINARN
jgi:type IV secretory pathway VirB10-like protein